MYVYAQGKKFYNLRTNIWPFACACNGIVNKRISSILLTYRVVLWHCRNVWCIFCTILPMYGGSGFVVKTNSPYTLNDIHFWHKCFETYTYVLFGGFLAMSPSMFDLLLTLLYITPCFRICYNFRAIFTQVVMIFKFRFYIS